MTVLVITARRDQTADMVVRRLASRGVPVFRCDTSEFPQDLTMTGLFDGKWRGELVSDRRRVRLADIRAVYYRRPTRFVFDEEMSDPERQWAQCR